MKKVLFPSEMKIILMPFKNLIFFQIFQAHRSNDEKFFSAFLKNNFQLKFMKCTSFNPILADCIL